MKERGTRGPVPSAELLTKMHTAGYFLVREIADELEIKLTTIYSWVSGKKLQAVGGKPAIKKVDSNVWVLKASVEVKRSIPSDMGVD